MPEDDNQDDRYDQWEASLNPLTDEELENSFGEDSESTEAPQEETVQEPPPLPVEERNQRLQKAARWHRIKNDIDPYADPDYGTPRDQALEMHRSQIESDEEYKKAVEISKRKAAKREPIRMISEREARKNQEGGDNT